MSYTEKDVQCRQIITKAVCAKGRKFSQANHTITPPHSPTSILGCWIINHTYEAEKVGDVVEVGGSYDINVWYSFNDNTKTEVGTETVTYAEQIPLALIDDNHLESDLEVLAKTTQPPTACEATITNSGNSVFVQVEREFLVEVIGETKVCVMVCQHGCDDEEEKDFTYEDDDLDEEFEDLDPDIVIDDLD